MHRLILLRFRCGRCSSQRLHHSDRQPPTGFWSQDARVIDRVRQTLLRDLEHHVILRKPYGKTAPAAGSTLEEHMQEMLNPMGFTSVGTWSDPRDTLPLRERVNSGDVPGPNIRFAVAFFPKAAILSICRLSCNSRSRTSDEATQMSRVILKRSAVSSFLPASIWATSLW